MTIQFKLSDVPTVDAAELGAAMRLLIENERGLALLKGLSEGEFRDLENEL